MESSTGSDFQAETPALLNPVAADSEAVTEDEGSAALGPDEWRREIADRLERYRSRHKPRAPHYPSLRLPFAAGESWSQGTATASPHPAPDSVPAPVSTPLAPMASGQNVPLQMEASPMPEPEPVPVPEPVVPPQISADPEPEYSAKILEFPRSAAIPDFHGDELADPILDRPRIVEAPEVVPPPPALGGMLMEAAAIREPAKRAETVRLPSASIPRRLLAGLVDGLIMIPALAVFAAVFLELTPQRGPAAVLAGSLVLATMMFWAAYEYLFFVYTGSTPGLRAARLRLTRFDGSPVPRRVRRWRVLASLLSAASLGLGYFWSMLDEDGLCWHDRITRTRIS